LIHSTTNLPRKEQIMNTYAGYTESQARIEDRKARIAAGTFGRRLAAATATPAAEAAAVEEVAGWLIAQAWQIGSESVAVMGEAAEQ
jgi:hypothetical protein